MSKQSKPKQTLVAAVWAFYVSLFGYAGVYFLTQAVNSKLNVFVGLVFTATGIVIVGVHMFKAHTN